jgi:hypothetical protein
MLRLKENPREWQKFVGVMGLTLNLPCWLLWWRGAIGWPLPLLAALVTVLALLAALLQPRWFRGFYRTGMTISYGIGQIIGKVLLTVFFFLLVTPLGLLLRCLGKDLLQFKKHPSDKSWWQPAKDNREFDRMF